MLDHLKNCWRIKSIITFYKICSVCCSWHQFQIISTEVFHEQEAVIWNLWPYLQKLIHFITPYPKLSDYGTCCLCKKSTLLIYIYWLTRMLCIHTHLIPYREERHVWWQLASTISLTINAKLSALINVWSLLLEIWISDKFYKDRGSEKYNCCSRQNSLKSDPIKWFESGFQWCIQIY